MRDINLLKQLLRWIGIDQLKNKWSEPADISESVIFEINRLSIQLLEQFKDETIRYYHKKLGAQKYIKKHDASELIISYWQVN